MKPLDPRLLRYAHSSRAYLAAGALIGLATTACIVATAWLITSAITQVIDGADADGLRGTLGLLALVVTARGILAWLAEVVGTRGAARVKSELRDSILDAVNRLGHDGLATRSSASLVTLVGHGLDALDDYFARYIPQLILTAVAVPVLLATVLSQDVLSAVILALTLPIIPTFMVLVGLATRAAQRAQWDALSRLSSRFLDVIGGLATLKIFGRERRQLARMRDITDDYRAQTMAVLRISFLSGFVLELFASLSVALVAVSIGFRLVDGSLGLATGLFVLLLAPEVFLPVRRIGANFHTAAEGVEAADDAFGILDAAADRPQVRPSAERVPAGDLVLDGVGVERDGIAIVTGVSAAIRRGTLTALTGRSGVGKSTLIGALAGMLPHTGTLMLGSELIPAAQPAGRSWLAWAPQHPALQSGTIAANVALGDPNPDDELVGRSLRLAAAEQLDQQRRLGVGGSGLSGGQAQRVGIARAVYRALRRGCSVAVFDEPTSALDAATEQRVAAGLRELAAAGIAVIVASHRSALVEVADTELALERAEVAA